MSDLAIDKIQVTKGAHAVSMPMHVWEKVVVETKQLRRELDEANFEIDDLIANLVQRDMQIAEYQRSLEDISIGNYQISAGMHAEETLKKWRKNE